MHFYQLFCDFGQTTQLAESQYSIGLGLEYKGKQTIRAKYDLRTFTGRFVQDDSHNNRDDLRADGADSRKQGAMLSNIFLSNYD